jgi:hypothetical protein
MTLAADGRKTVVLVVTLFAAGVLLQRFAVPGLPVALLLPIVMLGSLHGLVQGLLVFDRRRLAAWMLASGAMLVATLLQSVMVDHSYISLKSWALLVTTWAPFTLRLVDRNRATYVVVLRAVVAVSVVLALACIAMLVVQLAGVRYDDVLAQVVPASLLLQDFVITYPVDFGSDIYKANAWIGLEPSIVSAQLGVGLVAALLLDARALTVLVLFVGLVATSAGSGFATLAIATGVMMLLPMRDKLRRYAIPFGLLLGLVVTTSIGQNLFARVTEVFSARSSANLRAVLPYQYLWPEWSGELERLLLGGGPGSSQAIVAESGILGLLVPTPIKIFYDYGLLAGAVLAAFIVLCYLGGPSLSLSIALFCTLWGLQPGSTTLVLLVPLLLLVTWWSPRGEPPIEITGPGESATAYRPRWTKTREVK